MTSAPASAGIPANDDSAPNDSSAADRPDAASARKRRRAGTGRTCPRKRAASDALGRTRHRARLRGTAIVAATTLGLVLGAGCSNGSGDDADPVVSSRAAGTAGGADSPQGSAGAAAAASAPGPQPTTTIPAPGFDGDLEVALVSLTVDGQLATLTVTFTPPSDSASTDSIAKMFGGLRPDFSLIDPVNLKRYVIVLDSRGSLLATDPVFAKSRNGQPVEARYTFAAPPADIQTIDIYLFDRLIFEDAGIAR